MAALLSNWQKVEEAAKSANEAHGSASRENAKYVDSLQGRLDKLTTAWQSFANSFMESDFLKGAVSGLTGLVEIIEKLTDSLGTLGTIGLGAGIFGLFRNFKSLKSYFNLFMALPTELRSVKGLFSDLGSAFTSSLSGMVGVAGLVVAAIGLVTSAIKNHYEEQARLRQETIDKSDAFLESAETFEQAYIKYSGRTDLTAEEEAELQTAINGTVDALGDKSSALQSIVNGSNDYLSSLEQIADAEREAAAAAAEAKRQASEEELRESAIGWESIDGSEVDIDLGTGSSEAIDIAKKMSSEFIKTTGVTGAETTRFVLSGNASTEEIVEYYNTLLDYQQKLQDADLTDTHAYDNVTAAIDSMSEAIGVYTDGVYDAAKAQYQLENGIPKTVDEYLKMREAILRSENVEGLSLDAKQIIAGNLDSEYGQVFDLTTVEAQARKFVGLIKGFGNGTKDGSNEIGVVETFLNMRTAVNNNECSVGEYMSQFDEIDKISENWSDKEKEEFNTSFGIDTDEIKNQYDNLYDYLFDKDIPRLFDGYEFTPEFRLEKDNIKEQEIKDFLDGLSASELQAVVNLKTEIDWENDSWNDILAQIKEEAKFIEDISFSVNLELEAEKLENLTTAITNSFSGAGLGAESMSHVIDMFGDLDGYDQSKLFERTAHGIRLNSDELRKLNDEYRNTNVDGLNNKIDALGERYLQTREELSDLTYGTEEYKQKAKDLEYLETLINETETLAAHYEGIASAYQTWQRAESAGSQRDMYESMIEGFENVDDEMSRGWLDDGTIEFLRLIKGETIPAIATTKELKEAYKSLDDTIKNTSYSVRDFFTVDEDGNSTNTGVYNFLNAVGQLEEEAFGGKDVVKRDKNRNIIGFDFKIAGGDEAVAEALGISEELVQIMVRAADDAGFVVSMDGTFQQLDVLKEKAQEAANELKNTFKITDYEFNLDTTKATGEGSIAEQYEKASNIWEQFKKNKNSDGTVNMDVKGAEEAFILVSTLQTMIDQLSEPVYMELDATQVEKDIQTPLSKLKEYETLTQQEHQLQLKGTDTSEIDKAQKEIIDYFESLDEETKIKLGIEGLSREEIEAKIEKGEIDIPASVDIQMDMSDDIKDMKLLMMNQLGLIEYEEVKLKVGYQIDDSLVDTLDSEEKEVVINFISKNEEWFNSLSEEKKEVIVNLIAENKDWYEELEDEEKEIVVDLVSSGVDIETLTNDETKEVIIDFVTKNEDEFNELTDEEKQVVIKYIAENKDAWENLSEDDKKVIVELVSSGVDLETLTDDETKEVVIDFVTENEDEFDNLKDEEKEVVVDLVTDDDALSALEEHQVEIEAFAEIFGVEEVDDLEEKLNNLDDEQILVLTEVIGKIKVDELKTAMDGLEDEDIKAIATAIGEGDVESLKTAVFNLEDHEVEAIAKAFGYEDVSGLKGAMDNLTDKDVQAIAETLGITDVDSLKAAIDRLSSKNVDAVANVDGTDDVNNLKSAISSLKGKTITIWAEIKKRASNLWSSLTGGGGVDGTAHVNGTAFADGTVNKSGRAFKQGNWGTKDSGVALGGELGPELLVRNGRWHLIGEQGAEFFGYKKDDIIFNADQTREIFEKGKITHGNGRGKALVGGTAFAGGSTGSGGMGSVGGGSTGSGGSGDSGNSGSNGNNSNGNNSSSSSEAEKFEETFDWIERAIERIERAIDRLDKKASRTWKSWSSRNSDLRKEISKIDEEINLQSDAYDAYMAEANSVGLSSEYKKLVQSGKMDISTITDEDLAEKIKKYQEYYDKAKECEDNLLDLQDDRMSKYMELFDNVLTKYDGILQGFDHTESMLDEYISQAEARGQMVSKDYYQALISNEKGNIVNLEKKRDELIKARDEWVAAGGDINSQDYFDMCSEIDATTQAIEEGETAILEYANSMRDIDWAVFDLLQERISNVTEEANFLIDLMSNDKLYDNNGRLTDQGMSTMGLHGQNYNVYMAQADKYADEIDRINRQLIIDPYDQNLINRRDELLELQQESILAAEDEKNAIRDMVEEGINLELDALQERIDKYNEALESQKDLYEYQKKIKEQTEEIGSLEKQMSAYEGDTSEEAKAKVQELKVSLEEAEENLKETEYEKYISDQQALLDELYNEYELILNTRLDNIDALISDMIAEINANASTIATTLSEKADSVGYTLSDSMQSIWNTNSTNLNGVITTYGDKFLSAQTTTNNALNTINANLQNMIAYFDAIANNEIESEDTDPSSNDTPTTPAEPTPPAPTNPTDPTDNTIKKGGKIKATGAKIYDYKGDKSGERQYYRNDPIYKVLEIDGSWIKARYHKLKSGVTGWFKKGDVKAYAAGAKKIISDELAWTQEKGREFIVRPSDGAILTPVAKGDSVLNAQATNNIWDFANSPAEFIKDNLDLGTVSVPNNSNVQSSYVQNFENIIFSMPNVHGYNELLTEMQRDKNFEKLIHSMTVDRLAGKSSLAKGKSIR